VPIEHPPTNPVPRNNGSAKSRRHKVRDGESWHSLASRYGVAAKQIIYLNFRTLKPEEINWYLRHYVGCNRQTKDGKNWMFSSTANPGIIYIPPDIAPAEDFEDQGPDDGTVVQGPTVLALDVAGMDTESKLYVVIEKTIPLLPGEAGDYLRQMLQPEALAIMAGVVVVWALSHFVGIGEIVDVIVLVVGAAAIGAAAFTAGQELGAFGLKTYRAESEPDLDAAANHLAKAIVLIGIEAVLALLLKKAPKAFRDQYRSPVPRIPSGPRSPGSRWFYKPSIKWDPKLPSHILGETTPWGDIKLNTRLTAAEAVKVARHEAVHMRFAPKFYPLRRIRIHLDVHSYNRSYVMRYIEEMLAQIRAELLTDGIHFKTIFEGLKFPVANGYVTVSKMVSEVAGVFLGPVNVTEMTLFAYFSAK
jgi:hypothetical protein